jgi:hypothetical protein
MNVSFQVNTPQVVCETIDGEVVIVNLEKGYYYSLLKTGAEVWSGIEQGSNRLHLIEQLARTYEASYEDITTAVDEFLDHLMREELISKVEGSTLDSPNFTVAIAPSTSKPQFEKPLLEKFTDMEDLLLLDPIHEVDVEAGWPNAKSA